MVKVVCRSCSGTGLVNSDWRANDSLTCMWCGGKNLADAPDADVTSREELIRMLKGHEWGWNHGYQQAVCAECFAEEHDGHKSGCKMAQAIGAPTRPTTGGSQG